MARIAGVNIPTNKRVVIALTYIHGIGDKFAREICEEVKIPMDRRVNELTDAGLRVFQLLHGCDDGTKAAAVHKVDVRHVQYHPPGCGAGLFAH